MASFLPLIKKAISSGLALEHLESSGADGLSIDVLYASYMRGKKQILDDENHRG